MMGRRMSEKEVGDREGKRCERENDGKKNEEARERG